jgi:FtsH-binding integral membrane protein
MEQLKLLMTYTTFHIGLYVTLVSALLSFLTFSPKQIRKNLYPYMVVTLVCFVVAGAFGGIIASSIPRFEDYIIFNTTKLGLFWIEDGPEGIGLFKTLASIEHGFFWLGITTAMIGIVWNSRPKKEIG